MAQKPYLIQFTDTWLSNDADRLPVNRLHRSQGTSQKFSLDVFKIILKARFQPYSNHIWCYYS